MKEPIKILFVEDNPSDLELVLRQIEYDKLKITGKVVETKDDYLKSLESFEPDIIISDYSLPQFDGMEALLLRNNLAPLIPFILVTGSINEEVAVDCIKKGADDYIIKGSLSRLAPAMKEAIRKKEMLLSVRQTEEALKESEQRFKQISEIAGEWIWEVNKDGLYTYISKTGEELLGYSAVEIVGKMHFYDFFIPEKKEEMKQSAMAFFDTKKPIIRFENENLHRDGHVVILETTGIPLVDEKGKLTGYRGVDTDITDRVRANKELVETKERFRTLFENTLVGLYRTTPEGKILLVNPALIKILGYDSVEEVQERNLEETGFDPTSPRSHFREIIEKDGKIEGHESVWQKKDGSLLHIRESAVAIRDSSGNLLFYEGNIEDITERKQMEEKVRESEAYYRTLVDLSPDGILISDLEGRVTYYSRKIHEIFSIPKGVNFLGTSILDWVSPDYHNQVMERVTEIIKGKFEPETREYRLRRYDKSEFWAELSSSPINNAAGNKGELLIICRDITERKKIADDLMRSKEKSEESDRLKTAFLNNISHEIRTPMNAIVGFCSLLNEPEQSEDTRLSYIEIILNSSNHLLSVVSDIIEISNIEAGILKLNLSEFNLNGRLQSLHKQFSPKTDEKGIKLVLNTILPDSMAYIRSDSTKIIQVISNLLDNAIKFTLEGQIRFGYYLKNNFLEFYVSDTGIGIQEDQCERIFERFYQIDSKNSRLYEGTGLGLSISKSFVEFLGGKIWVNSEPGTGAVFYFNIPYSNAIGFKERQEVTEIGSTNRNNEIKAVLIAEDEENNYLLVREFLSSLNLNILHAANGKEAVQLCRSGERIDLVLMDIKMPVMDGYEATKEIRSFLPTLPIIATTAYTLEADRTKALKSGCSDYISKPIRKASLLEKVNKYLS
jgi:PAS domain S-box-containing protein